MLLEAATGYLTGAVYNDRSLKTILKGEGVHTAKVIVTKAHPTRWTYNKLQKYYGPKFAAVLLVRDPYRMLWSEGQRRLLKTAAARKFHHHHGDPVGVHTARMSKAYLKQNMATWEALALSLVNDYVRMWTEEYTRLAAAGGNVTFLDFDLLTRPAAREAELRRVLNFLGSGWRSTSASCAFEAETSKGAHRPTAQPGTEFATIQDAMPSVLVCKLWEIISTAEAAARDLGYNWQYVPFGGARC